MGKEMSRDPVAGEVWGTDYSKSPDPFERTKKDSTWTVVRVEDGYVQYRSGNYETSATLSVFKSCYPKNYSLIGEEVEEKYVFPINTFNCETDYLLKKGTPEDKRKALEALYSITDKLEKSLIP